MFVQVYRSERKADTYLYVEQGKKFDELPEALISMLGQLEAIMLVNLNERKELALISAEDLASRIKEDGYWLQFPPSEGHILDSEQCPV